MSGSTRSSENLDMRRRRILFRAWHRGTREMDLIMGGFCDAQIASLSEAEIDDFERLIDLPDHDLYRWVIGEAELPAALDTTLFRKMRDFHSHTRPLFS
jgi:antitoxin CptB